MMIFVKISSQWDLKGRDGRYDDTVCLHDQGAKMSKGYKILNKDF